MRYPKRSYEAAFRPDSLSLKPLMSSTKVTEAFFKTLVNQFVEHYLYPSKFYLVGKFHLLH